MTLLGTTGKETGTAEKETGTAEKKAGTAGKKAGAVPATGRPARRIPAGVAALRWTALRLLALAVLLAAWQSVVAAGVWPRVLVPSPGDVWQAFVKASTVRD
ncbi:hypothetical protein ACFCXG_40135, partial [Streptomyces sp. NPDC056295]